ncbi:hypothetical protein BJ138DRAFT_1020070 [Hygrophoropsis aurantiaca]|uniref:Uncharacterized protein n=1 Tax=Hygrophoropsis aurantiaca TaxID=72124 RepID=A0ACB7ZS93_9AGAM|nr:hypothetical protein BJ138DRAFT_1020070 [Hygrophoropsis aurantiaca]
MPRVSKRTRLLDDAEQYGRATKRRRLQSLVEALIDDLPDTDSSSSDSDSSNSSSISSNSSISSTSSLSSGHESSQSTGSSESQTFEELEDAARIAWNARFRAFVELIRTTRVLEPLPKVPKVSQLGLVLDGYRVDDPTRFRRNLRCPPSTFDALVALLEPNPIFHNNSNIPQLPVPYQLAMFLRRAGNYGNASSPEDVAQWAGLSVGAVEKSTNRVLVAIDDLHKKAMELPGDAQREASGDWVEARTTKLWRGGKFTTDGTTFPLFERPGLHGDTWFDKNKNYSINAQVIALFVH